MRAQLITNKEDLDHEQRIILESEKEDLDHKQRIILESEYMRICMAMSEGEEQ